MFKKLLTALVVAGTVSTATAQQSVTGNVDLEIIMPEVLVLYHWNKATITFNDFYKDMNKTTQVTAEATSELNVQSITVTKDPVLDTTSPLTNTNGDKIAVTLKNAWAVRTLTASGNAKIKVENPNPSHTKDASTITTSDATVSSGSISAASEITLPSKWEPTLGDINFNLDLSGATKSGLHESTDSTFQLTLSSVQ